ncbi:Lsr2 family protein [Streptomyces sp. AJS327]|uniref:histone-like nucleoid-structuring protein Lsr2 n=1 Tax=Streptomyces sp. AJS327 TaxID=2545265 RepID=UPI0015E02613|nr:Lsr2 family protein [Streptomyces sp. AJS327]MBA0052237.1 Lsr2 family protein [Streptomyces sp. AJS327]
MAQKVVTIVTDDLTGEESEDAKTVPFSVDGIEYEIDLSPESKDSLLEALGPFIQAGRRVRKSRGAVGSPRKSAGRPQTNPDTAKIREWAKEQGYEVNERGRIPAGIQDAYAKAH